MSLKGAKTVQYKVSFGEAVDIDGGVAVVGANAYRSGDVSAYVFRRIRAKWFEDGKLLPDGSYLNDFGMGLSIVAVWGELKRTSYADHFNSPASNKNSSRGLITTCLMPSANSSLNGIFITTSVAALLHCPFCPMPNTDPSAYN
eukprot:scaffold14691_cov152-Skeletonema_dohrnii-CCMP3373.AAC.4